MEAVAVAGARYRAVDNLCRVDQVLRLLGLEVRHVVAIRGGEVCDERALAALDEHGVAPPSHVEEAGVVQSTTVASREPTVSGESGGLSPVLAGYLFATYPDLAGAP